MFGPFPPPHGGVQTHLVALRQFLLEAGVRVSVINVTRHRKTEGDGVYYPRNAVELVWRTRELRPDLIHLHLGGDLTPRLFGLCGVSGLWPGAKSVLTFHSGGYPTSAAGRRASRRSFGGWALRRLDHLVAVNTAIETVFHRFGVPPERTSVIEPHSRTAPAQGGALPADLAAFAAAHRPLLVTVGQLEPEYLLPLQIEALPGIREHASDAGLMIVGSGSMEQELQRQIARSPVREHIRLCGDLPHALTLGLIGRADALLRITAYDGDAISVREALQLGTPVLATDNGMRPDGVQLLAESNREMLVKGVLEVATRARENDPGGTIADDRNLAKVLALYRRLVGDA